MNPLTDVPVDIAAVNSPDGRAMLQWTNTTAAWSAEVEFWVRPAGASSFANNKTEKVSVLGARQTPFLVFRSGDSVMGRVRYYNAYGEAGWSAFSNAVTMPVVQVSKGTGGKRAPRFCVLPIGSC